MTSWNTSSSMLTRKQSASCAHLPRRKRTWRRRALRSKRTVRVLGFDSIHFINRSRFRVIISLCAVQSLPGFVFRCFRIWPAWPFNPSFAFHCSLSLLSLSAFNLNLNYNFEFACDRTNEALKVWWSWMAKRGCWSGIGFQPRRFGNLNMQQAARWMPSRKKMQRSWSSMPRLRRC